MDTFLPDALPVACDCCTHAILTPEQGVIFSIPAPDPTLPTQILIVHAPGAHPDCQFGPMEAPGAEFVPLWEATGAGGLAYLCERLKAEPSSVPAIAEIIQRLFIPAYDRIRYLRAAPAPALERPSDGKDFESPLP